MSLKGPICTWNSLSLLFEAMNTGYDFRRNALSNASASSCLETAAICTVKARGAGVIDVPLPSSGAKLDPAAEVGVTVGAGPVAPFCADESVGFDAASSGAGAGLCGV